VKRGTAPANCRTCGDPYFVRGALGDELGRLPGTPGARFRF